MSFYTCIACREKLLNTPRYATADGDVCEDCYEDTCRLEGVDKTKQARVDRLKATQKRLLQISGMLVLANDPQYLQWAKRDLAELTNDLKKHIEDESYEAIN